MDKRERLLSKIKKLLALARSTNPHEAAAALKQAQKLMQEHHIQQSEVEISESQNGQKFAKKAPQYIHGLAAVIEKAFGVRCYFRVGGYPVKCNAVFFGQDERPEIASYCFDVLFRQLNAARKEFNASQSKRLKRSTLISRADTFCEGWVSGVHQSVKEFALNLTEQEETALANYQQLLRETRHLKEGKARESGNTRERNGDNARWQGYQQGKKVKLNHGVNGQEQGKLVIKK